MEWSAPVVMSTLLLGVTVGLLVWLMMRRPHGIPPGPRLRIPLLGYVPFLRGNMLKNFAGLRNTYGDIYHIYLGNKLAIVLNGYDVIREALVGDAFADRPDFAVFEDFGEDKGIISTSGWIWKEQRKFALEALREFGFGRNILQEKILEEISFLLSSIEDEKGQPFDPQVLTHTAVSNVTCNIIFGRRFQYDDASFHGYIRDMEQIFKGGVQSLGLSFLAKLPGDLFGIKASIRCLNNIRRKLIDVSVKDHKENFHNEAIGDFIDAYIAEMKKKEIQQVPTSITEDHLWRSILDLFVASTETTGTTIRWALLYLLNYPEVQRRIYNELQENVGSGRCPTLEDRNQLPFLSAFIQEVLRHADVAPFTIPHSPTEDAFLRGYRIPKGTIVLSILDSVLKDPKLWKDPDVFLPERFIQDGKVVKPDYFIPFSLGRRVCLGESLARMELFLFLAHVIQRFQLQCEDSNNPPTLEGNLGTSHSPKPFRLRAIRRS